MLVGIKIYRLPFDIIAKAIHELRRFRFDPIEDVIV